MRVTLCPLAALAVQLALSGLHDVGVIHPTQPLREHR